MDQTLPKRTFPTAVKTAIHGFGRIGRLVLRSIDEQGLMDELEIVAVGDIVPADNLAYLLRYDTTQGRFPGIVGSARSSPDLPDADLLLINGRAIRVVSARSPVEPPWSRLGVELVIESTGLFADAAKARAHLEAGARKVIITAPAKGADTTLAIGINDHAYDPARHHIISNASCTTNCLAAVVHVILKEGFGLIEGLMTSVHACTASQKTVDGPSRRDWKGGRAAGINIIPSSTGAARAVGLVLPEVNGRLTGMSFRVPVPTVSVVDLTFRTARETSLDEIKAAMKHASETYLSGILAYTAEEVVSTDFIHDRHSAIFDAGASVELNHSFFKLVACYDNEWGYSHRVVDLARKVAAAL